MSVRWTTKLDNELEDILRDVLKMSQAYEATLELMTAAGATMPLAGLDAILLSVGVATKIMSFAEKMENLWSAVEASGPKTT